MIEFRNVSYSYPGRQKSPALDDFSLKINEGEDIAVVGGNGSGKTTFGLLLAGILSPQAGEILINGQSISEVKQKPSIGFLFQDPENGLVATTIDREVAFSLENQNIDSSVMKPLVEKQLEVFDLLQYRDRLVWHLSGGEKQRLSLAAIMISKPKILFLDEPASYLDYKGRKILEDCLNSIKRTDCTITIIRITQFPELAERYKRVLVLNAGKVIIDGSPRHVFSQKDLIKRAGLRSPLRYLTARSKGSVTLDRLNLQDDKPAAIISSLFFKYNIKDERYVINNINLSLYRNKITALAGPSGSGKSTLAQLICGIYKPQSGSIEFCPDHISAVMSFQQPEKQFFCDTVFDEVAYGLRNGKRSLDEIEKEVKTSLETLALDYDTFKDRDPFSLSGGESRRLAFAITISLNKDLVIFDEPTCGLDERSIRVFKDLVFRLKHEAKAVIVITHNSDLIGDIADEVILMHNGQVQLMTEPLEFFQIPGVKEVLSIPQVIEYQIEKYGEAYTTRTEDIFAF